MALVRLEKLGKSYGHVEVLKDINLEIADGEFVVLVGPSGCGKSTLLRSISGLEKVSSGRILVADKDATNLEPVERGVGMVFQSYALYPHMTVAENIGFGLKIAKTAKSDIQNTVLEVAKVLKLDQLLDRKPRELSGGQRQRVAIGRSLARQPNIFLFDEPLSNLDAALRVEMRVELSKLHARLKSTMIYVTHDQVEAMTMADRIVVMDHGTIMQVGTPLELFNNPCSRFVAGFLGQPSTNFVRVQSIKPSGGGSVVEISGGDIAIADAPETIGSAVEIGLRPDTFELTIDPAAAALVCTVELAEQLGDETLFHTLLDSGEKLVLKIKGQHTKAAGDQLSLKSTQKHPMVFDDSGKNLLYRG